MIQEYAFKMGAGKPKHGQAILWTFELLCNLNVISIFLLSCKCIKLPLRETILLKFEIY